MIKKILFAFFIFISISLFSQTKTVTNLKASPNPFKDSTEISFDSSEEQGVILIVKNILGKTIFAKAYYTSKGKRLIKFNRENLKSGMYIYAIQTRNETISKRFVIK